MDVGKRPGTRWLIFSQLILLLLAACQGQLAASVDAPAAAQAAQTPAPSPTLIPTQPVPPPVFTVTASVDENAGAMPAFALPSAAELTRTAQPTAVPTSTPIASPTITNTPSPTPPHLPYTSPDEHYWLRRPVPEGDTVWTDKVYPYGSTRGDTLRPHHGVEFYVDYNTEILAAASGVVRVAGNDSAAAYGPHTDFYGNLIIIEHEPRYQGQPVYTLYAHLNKLLVEAGQTVHAQQLIGLSGATGVADGPHLHFEVRVGQNSYDSTRNPLLWLYPFPDRGTVAGRIAWANGRLASEMLVTLKRLDGPAPTYQTTTYALSGVNSDELWQENFVIDDVYAGQYKVTVEIGEEKFTEEIRVQTYQTTFFEIVLDN